MTVEDNYKMIPNNVVQNIVIGNITMDSFIQLYGKRTVAYLYLMFEFQNNKSYSNFTINMILKMLKIKSNIFREQNYLKQFINAIIKDNKIDSILVNNILIEINNDYCFNADVNDIISLKLNVHEYDKYDKYDKKHKTINYFLLLDSEFSKIINSKSDLDKFNLLNLYCNIKSRIRKNHKNASVAEGEQKPEVCYPSYDTIKFDIFIESDKTLKLYIDELYKLDMIRYKCAGDMIFKVEGQNPIRRKANFTYALFRQCWEIELNNAIEDFRNKKRQSGWSFISTNDEISADEKRSISQKINILEKLKSMGKILTQKQIKELSKLKRKKEKWQIEYDENIDVRKLEEDKLKQDNSEKVLSEIYSEKGFEAKANRAKVEEKLSNVSNGKKPPKYIKKVIKSNSAWEIEETQKCNNCGFPTVNGNDLCIDCLDSLEKSLVRTGDIN